tara:strand:+ start:1509 stop:1976 length:468 start_codon:yes stop_codon:yes gene_type:complete
MLGLAIVAAVLSVARLPSDWFAWIGLWQPQWLLLLLMYWALQVGSRLGVLWAWFAGGVVDVLLGEPLGLNGIIFAAITYLALRFRERFLMYGLIQQAIIVFVVVMLAQLLRTLSLNFFANQDWNWLPLTTALSSALLWPYSYKLFKALEPRRGFR